MSSWPDFVRDAAKSGRAADLALLVDEAPDPLSRHWAAGLLETTEAGPRGAVFLFAGLMVDHRDAVTERFPPEAVEAVGAAIDSALEELGAGPGDHAVVGGACGGDLLFAERALQHGLLIDVLVPFEVAEFLEQSVSFAGEEWGALFNTVVDDERVELHVMPQAIGEAGEANPYERTNRWLLEYAVAGRSDALNLILVWDGSPGRGPGGTGDLYDRARGTATAVRVIDPTTL